MTKRLSAGCFRSDKGIAMLTGRPPALSHRYYTCPLPLDLPDSILLEGGESLQREIDALDENGWNTKGEIYDGTICRMTVLSAIIQDEVIELFLGKPAYFSMERVKYASTPSSTKNIHLTFMSSDLKTRTFQTFATIPHLTSVTEEILIASDSDCWMWRLFFARMDYLRIHFLLERLRVERGHESKQDLLDVSRELIDLTVFLWLQRDRSFSTYQCFDYIVSIQHHTIGQTLLSFYLFQNCWLILPPLRLCATGCHQQESYAPSSSSKFVPRTV